MTDSENPQHQQILSANAELREWAAGLRVWSRTTRDAAAEGRRRRHVLMSTALLLAPDRRSDHEGLPALEPVTVAELRQILVRDHGFHARDADRALATGLLLAGYPPGHERIAAADAFDVMEIILDARW